MTTNISKEEFLVHVARAANTGSLIKLPESLDKVTCGNIMAEVAGKFIDIGQDLKAIIILEERRRLGV